MSDAVQLLFEIRYAWLAKGTSSNFSDTFISHVGGQNSRSFLIKSPYFKGTVRKKWIIAIFNTPLFTSLKRRKKVLLLQLQTNAFRTSFKE